MCDKKELKLPSGLAAPKTLTGNRDDTEPPNVLICFKNLKKSTDKKDKNAEGGEKKKRKRAKSRELRAGILYNGCNCERRNGLQDDCPRSSCQGSPECLTVPPTCRNSKFANAKHLKKKFEEWWKARQAFLDELERKKMRQPKKGTNDEVHYDCIPLDVLMKDSTSCPICSQPMGGAVHRRNDPTIVVGPIKIDVPCCAAAC